MSARLRTLKGWLKNPDLQAVAILFFFSLPFTLPALDCYFTFDLLMNLDRSVDAFWSHVLGVLTLFPPPSRPLGGLVTLSIFHLMGFEPAYYYFVGICIFTANLMVLYLFARRLTGSPLFALLAAALAGYCPANHNVLYNFGSIYELLTLSFVLASLFSYRRHLLQQVSSRYYWLAFAAFLAALESKEIAVVLPGVLVAYELLVHSENWGDRKLWHGIGRRMVPFLLVCCPYLIIKAVGPWATGRGNSLYELHFDSRIVQNFAAYLTALTNTKIEFSSGGALLTLALVTIAALLLRNRVALFGIVWSIAFLLPVLPLPRVWQLFLYVPLFGFSLVVVSLLFEVGRRLPALLFEEPPRIRYAGLWKLLLFLVVTARVQGAMAPAFRRAFQGNYDTVTAPFRSFAGQFSAMYPTLESGTVLVFRGLPVREPFEQWVPLFLIQLGYRNREIRVFNLPTQDELYRQANLAKAPAKHFFTWEDGRLVERAEGPDFEARTP